MRPIPSTMPVLVVHRFAIGRWRQEGQNSEGRPQGGQRGRGRGRASSASPLPHMPQVSEGIVAGKPRAAVVASPRPRRRF